MIRKPLPFIIACLLFTVGVPLYSVAQAAGLALTLQNYTVQPNSGQVNIGYRITINAELTNTDTVDFTGQVDFGLRNSNGVINNGGIFYKPWYSDTPTITLAPGETVPAVFSVDVESPYFAPGPDVVVVWPISTKPVADSILIELQVVGPNTLMGQQEAEFNYLILGDKIILRDVPFNSPVQQVRLYNAYGQLVAGSGGGNEIPIELLPGGIYLCEVTLTNRTRKVIKFVH